jgi:uncharacterized membrane protein YeaQ/YmgE (transglycosylase-associated protein family)
MKLLFWLLIGLAAGAIAKMVTPQEEKGGWVSSIIIGIIGSYVGKIIFGLVGIKATSVLGGVIFATVGAIIVLFVYHKYLADKLNLPI